jgi:cytoskeleton protein RodZ
LENLLVATLASLQSKISNILCAICGENGLSITFTVTGGYEMKRLGESLRRERQARGISLQQIAADTRISMKMLQAIEEGDDEQLPAPVLIKGFLRAYAQRIGLDPEDVIIAYQDGIEELGGYEEAIEKFHHKLHPKSSKKKFFALLLLGFGLLLGFTIIWSQGSFLPQKSKPPAEGKSLPSVEASQEASRADSASEVTEKLYTQDPSKAVEEVEADIQPERKISQPSGGETSVNSSRTPFVLRVDAVEKTWLRIIIDGSREREYLLQPGEQLTWMATSDMQVLVGNAGGIRLYLNDNPLKPLGQSGEVVRLQLPDPSLTGEAVSQGTDSGIRQ